ncbi:MAG: L-lysine 6-transaminase, partial [Myxococcota bacterium]
MVAASETQEVLSRWIQASGLDLVFDPSRSRGAYLYDSKHDREYLDFSGFDSSRVLSFDHEGLKDASFTEQLARAAE